MSDVASSVYHGAVEVERVKTLVGAICATLIGMCICSLGAYLFTKKTESTEATVNKISCSVVGGKTSCDVTITYLAKETSYTTTINSSINYDVGTKVTIDYDPADPQIATIHNKVSNAIAGVGSMICALCIVSAGWGWWYVTNKYESVAAVQAVGDTLSILRR